MENYKCKHTQKKNKYKEPLQQPGIYRSFIRSEAKGQFSNGINICRPGFFFFFLFFSFLFTQLAGKYFVSHLVFIYFIGKCVVLINRFSMGVLFLKKESTQFQKFVDEEQ